MIQINHPRRTGKSTRLADSYIQELFTSGNIKVKDCWKNNHALDKDLFEKIVRRLSIEHPNMNFKFRKGDLTIEIKPSK